jgi:hypothetical protein
MSEEGSHLLLKVAEAWEAAGIVGVVGVFLGVALVCVAFALLVGYLVSQGVLPDCVAHNTCGPEFESGFERLAGRFFLGGAVVGATAGSAANVGIRKYLEKHRRS